MKKNLNQPDRPMQPIRNFSYILRVWCCDQSEASDWRASLEIPETGKRLGFASLEQLFAYLIDLTECNSNLQPIENKKKEIDNT